MSYYVIHILNHSSKLSIDRGCLVCTSPDQPERRIPKSDVLGIIVAAHGVIFTADCISNLLENNCVILHCDKKYKPIGKTVRLNQIVHNDIFGRQIERQSDFYNALWNRLWRTKVSNQAKLLDILGIKHLLWNLLNQQKYDESHLARYYWGYYFRLFKNHPKIREHRKANHPINQMLNYSYAVMNAIIHRSAIIHGLNTQLGIHHKYRFKSDPLVYDLIEPLRPICEYMLAKFHIQNPQKPIQDWLKYIANNLINLRVKTKYEKTIKMLYGIDRYVSSVTNCFNTGSLKNLFLIDLSDIIIEKHNEK